MTAMSMSPLLVEEPGQNRLLNPFARAPKVSNRVDECVMEEVRKWWQRRKELVYGGSPHEPGPPYNPQTPPPPPQKKKKKNILN